MWSPLYISRISTAWLLSVDHSSPLPLISVMLRPRKCAMKTIVNASGSEVSCILSDKYPNPLLIFVSVVAAHS